jgi:hypothetical protein
MPLSALLLPCSTRPKLQNRNFLRLVPVANENDDIEAIYQSMQLRGERPDSACGGPVSDGNQIDDGPTRVAEKRLEGLKIACRRRSAIIRISSYESKVNAFGYDRA